MNYRHIYHAGNRCDVVKHAVLTLILAHLRQKDKGFVVIDTHAGIGIYDLNDPRALKTCEAAAGIQNLVGAAPIPALADYHTVLRKLNPLWDGNGAEGLRIYAGSPLFAFHLLRPQDRLVACERHPEDFETLRLNSPADPRFQIHARDGYEALNGMVPPPEKRGLVLIDPPYEQADEFSTVVEKITAAYRRWPTGMYMLWYPVKDRPALWNFHEKLVASGMPKILCAEFIYAHETRSDRLNGSGLILINPPWQLDAQLVTLFPALHQAMQTEYDGVTVKWLVN